MRELFAEFGAREIVDFAVGLVGCWRHLFFLFFSFLLWVGFEVGFEVGWVLCSGGWWLVVGGWWLLRFCGFGF